MRYLTVNEVTVIFLKSLVQSAEDFLGRKVQGAVIAIPTWFDENAKNAVTAAATEAGVEVLQLIDEKSAAALVSVSLPSAKVEADRTSLVVDLGQNTLTLSLLSIRHGLIYSIASSEDHNVGGEQIDEKLVKFFAKEFTKKTKTPLQVCPATEAADKRAEAKFRLAVEHTKRTISASPGAATCAVESLKDGLDFSGTINRMRFDMEARSVYDGVTSAAIKLLNSVDLEPLHVDEIIYAGSSTALPGLDNTFFAKGFPESVVTPFNAGTAVGGPGDPTTIIARGCVLQAKVLTSISAENHMLRDAFQPTSEHLQTSVTTKTIGLILPEAVSDSEGTTNSLGGQWIPGVPKDTPTPYRRIVQFDCDLGEGEGQSVGLEVWEVDESVKVEKVKPVKKDAEAEEEEEDDSDSDSDEEEQEEEIREKQITKSNLIGSFSVVSKHAQSQNGRRKTRLEVHFVVVQNGNVSVTAFEISKEGKGEPIVLTVPHL